MDRDLYRLPGRRSQRRRVVTRMLLGYGFAALIGSGVATQWIAWKLRHPPWLGPPSLELYGDQARGALVLAVLLAGASLASALHKPSRSGAGALLLGSLAALLAASEPLYEPWRWLAWRPKLLEAPAILDHAAIAGALAGLLVAWQVSWQGLRALRKLPLRGDSHGSAHYATPAEVEASGFLRPTDDGIVLGKYQGRVLRAGADEHVLLFSPPGTGKSSALAVPTLLGWQGSAVVLDVKRELYDLTAGYRSTALRNDVLRVDFSASSTERLARFNPLLWIPKGEREVAAAQTVADVLAGNSEATQEDFWRERAQELLTALILHTLYKDPGPSLAACRELLRGEALTRVLKEMLLTRHDPAHQAGWLRQGAPSATHPEVAGTAQSLLSMAHETRSGIVANAERALRLFGDPRLAANTAWSDFAPGDLMDREKPVTLYLTVPGGEIVRLGPILRLFLTQLVLELLNRPVATDPKNVSYRHRLLLILDEFPAFGRLRFLERAAGILRGYGVVLCIIVQSVTQLQRLYGAHETVSGICPVHVTMGASDLETAERISKRLGRRTVDRERKSLSVRGRKGTSVSESDHGRFLLEADEVARLPKDRLLIMALGRPPVLAERSAYFEDRLWRKRTKIAPPPSVRFEHDWSHWSEHRSQAPDADELLAYPDEPEDGKTRHRGLEIPSS